MSDPIRAALLVCALAFAAFATPSLAQQLAGSSQSAPFSDDARANPDQRMLDDIAGLQGVRATRHGGLVVLEGEVSRTEERELAEQVLRANGETREVVNRIEVGAATRTRLLSSLTVSGQKLLRLFGQLPLLLVALGVGWAFWRVGRWLSARTWIERRSRSNPLVTEILRQAIRFGAGIVGLLVALEILDATALATALLGSAGVVGIALGFAFRDLLENYIAGVLLSVRRPFSPDDVVALEGREGVVVGMNSRATLLMTHDGNHLTLPNAVVFKAAILNYSRNGKRRFDFTVALDPAVDAATALRVGLEAVRATPDVLETPAASAELADTPRDELRLRFFGWVDQHSGNFGRARSEALRTVRAKLQEMGASFAPPVLRVLSITEAGEIARDVAANEDADIAHTAPPPHADPQHATRDAVRRTRAEMGETDLLQRGARE